jgi:hypothetical protein
MVEFDTSEELEAKNHLRPSRKRTGDDNISFEESFEKLVLSAKRETISDLDC